MGIHTISYIYPGACQRVNERISKYSHHKWSSSYVYHHVLPAFIECIIGKELGVGGFSIVYEVKELCLFKDINANNSTSRAEIASRTKRDGQARYAIKRLKNATIRKSASQNKDVQYQFVAGVTDLAMEVKILTVLNHPHIIKMRGFSSADLCSRDSFIIIDRLHETLDARILSWKSSKRRLSGGLGLVLDSKGRKKEKLFAQRISVAYSLSSAIEYLHSHRWDQWWWILLHVHRETGVQHHPVLRSSCCCYLLFSTTVHVLRSNNLSHVYIYPIFTSSNERIVYRDLVSLQSYSFLAPTHFLHFLTSHLQILLAM